ncbi:electron transfer flavoprotein subunit beta/FixA family protein [Ruminococcus bromii]|uniref:electron transfer flavoprotein subunit beta/FixA family protein n=1 Tax=Ruminococcus bromii TaxID=40518 RepID=UPI003FD80FB9
MDIVVCIKQVPNTSEVKIDPKTNNLVRENIPSMMNPYDENAMEEALKLKDKFGAKVTAISMGPPQAKEVLQEALAMGADRAILLSDRKLGGADTLATGYTLSTLIGTLKPDLVFCGSEAVDGCTGQVGPIIAENLDMAQCTYVNEIIGLEENHIVVSRELIDVYKIFRVEFPAVLCTLKGINVPRKPGKNEKQVEVMDAETAGLSDERIGLNGSPTRVVTIDMSENKTSGFVMIDSSLPAKERIKAIINGGVEPKKVNLLRGTPEQLAKKIISDEDVSRYL